MGHKWDDSNTSDLIKLGIRPFFMVAVNCYILISGWFSINYNFKKLIKLNTMVTFWTVLIGALAVIFGLHQISIRQDILMLFPVVTKTYWFITVYFVLCFLAPYLNKLAANLSKEEFKRLLKISFLLFVILPTIAFTFNFQSITQDAGYGIVNFMFLYMTGRYLRLHHVSRLSKWQDLMIYIAAATASGVCQICISKALGFEFTSYLSYDTIFQFFGAIGLFMFFSKVNITSQTINKVATFCLATYVIHLHPWTFKWLLQDLLHGNEISGAAYLLYILFVPFIIFAICIALEWLRQLVMRK
jgi:hypothetical protein